MYKKLIVSFIEDEKNLNREIIVDGDIGLVNLRLILTATLGASFCHLTEFEDHDIVYAENAGYDEYQNNQKLMSDFSLNDLSNNFIFSYDFGECWDFKIEVTDIPKPKEMKGIVKIESGFGAGIWEDNKHGHYQACLLTSTERKRIKSTTESEVYPPWNLQYKNIDELFQPIDIKANQLRTDFMLEIFEDTYIKEIQTGKYFNDRYKSDEVWKFTKNGLSTEDKISVLQNYSDKIDGDEYENLSRLISENNVFYLEQFHEWIIDNGCTQLTANRHRDNISTYISTFLCRHFIQPCKYGTQFINLEWYHNKFLIYNTTWGSPANVAASCASIKKFYKFMKEYGYISQDELEDCLDTIKENRARWIDKAEAAW